MWWQFFFCSFLCSILHLQPRNTLQFLSSASNSTCGQPFPSHLWLSMTRFFPTSPSLRSNPSSLSDLWLTFLKHCFSSKPPGTLSLRMLSMSTSSSGSYCAWLDRTHRHSANWSGSARACSQPPSGFGIVRLTRIPESTDANLTNLAASWNCFDKFSLCLPFCHFTARSSRKSGVKISARSSWTFGVLCGRTHLVRSSTTNKERESLTTSGWMTTWTTWRQFSGTMSSILGKLIRGFFIIEELV